MPFYSHKLCFGKTQMDVIQLTNSASKANATAPLHTGMALPIHGHSINHQRLNDFLSARDMISMFGARGVRDKTN